MAHPLSVYSRTCGPSDYEAWSPSNGRTYKDGLQCFMGRDITYRRRNATADCFNSEVIDPVLNVIYCPCAEDDWECDIGYERDPQDATKCIRTGPEPKYPPSTCTPGHTYNKTKGYVVWELVLIGLQLSQSCWNTLLSGKGSESLWGGSFPLP